MNNFILILFISFSLICESIILDRKQLAEWVPDFNVTKSVQLMYADITSIETNTFDGLTNIQQIILYFNQIASLSPNTFCSLINLQVLWLHINILTNVDYAFKCKFRAIDSFLQLV